MRGVGRGVWAGGRTRGSDEVAGKFSKFHFSLLTCHPTWTSFILRVLAWVK